MRPLQERYADRIQGVLSCFDRMILTGTLTCVSCPRGLAAFLKSIELPLADFATWAQRLTQELVKHVEELAKQEGLKIEYVSRTRDFKKEARIQAILAERGHHPGLVHILSVVEPCQTFRVYTNGKTGQRFLVLREGKCKHYYFYFIDPQFGLCYLRVPTWAPFKLQFYCNGHSWLARQMEREGIAFTQVDNAFTQIADWQRAQHLADHFPMRQLHQALDEFATRYCPIYSQLDATYHWGIMQAELATDLVFATREQLQPLYENLSRTAILVIKAGDVASFLGHRIPRKKESGSKFQTRIEGTRIRHHLGPAALKMYDKFGHILRIETTINDVSFFRHHREVVHHDKPSSIKMAEMKKTIYSLEILGTILTACNGRYLDYLAALDDPTAGVEAADRLGAPVHQHGRTYRGFNLFTRLDLRLFRAIARGEWALRGFSNQNLRDHLGGVTGPQVTRLLQRLRLHGYIQRLTRTHRYRLTTEGRRLTLGALKLREFTVVPALAAA